MTNGEHRPGTIEAARAVKAKARELIEALVPVEGVGITRVGDAYAVKINVAQDIDAKLAIPEEVDGVPIVVQVTGRVRKQGRDERRRP